MCQLPSVGLAALIRAMLRKLALQSYHKLETMAVLTASVSPGLRGQSQP